jgi:transcriptional regulator with XRE-family HTH domain
MGRIGTVRRRFYIPPERLRAARAHAKISRQQLGAAVGRSDQTVMLWELGRVRPPDRVVALICTALGVSADELCDTAVSA